MVEDIRGKHYTCTSTLLSKTDGSQPEHIAWNVLMPRIIAKLGREPEDLIEATIVAEQVIRDSKR